MTVRKDAREESNDPIDRYFAERGVSAAVRSKGLNGIIATWDTIARGAERYDLTLDDWLNDLDLRDIISGAMAVVPEANARDLRDALERADDAFRSATIEVEQSLWGVPLDGEASARQHNRVSQWWYFRYPRRPGFSMRRDLESAGIAPPTRARRKK
jgi:hypothetical protein